MSTTNSRRIRPKKFVVWLHNHTDNRDDEWCVVWAKNKASIKEADIQYNSNRFSRGATLTVTQFRKRMGIAP